MRKAALAVAVVSCIYGSYLFIQTGRTVPQQVVAASSAADARPAQSVSKATYSVANSDMLTAPVAGDQVGMANAPALFAAGNASYDKRLLVVQGDERTPTFIENAEQGRKLILDNARELLGIGPNDDIRIKTTKTDDLGNTYRKYSQVFAGVPVYGRELVVQTDASNKVKAIMGEFESDIEIATAPQLEGKDAVNSYFREHANEIVGEPVIHEEPRLLIYTSEGVPPTLSYRSVAEYTTHETGTHLEELYVDAHSGRLIDSIPLVHSALTRNVYTYNDQCLSQSSSNLPGTKINDPANGDDHAKGAYNNTGSSYNFFSRMFARDSFDAQGVAITATVHAKFNFGQGSCSGDNAVFDTQRKQLIFGSGGTNLSNPAGALDIVAHEFTHGVTATDSNLTYQNESGALNEAISDIFGAGADAWVDSGGTASSDPPAGIQPNENTWVMGEDAALTTTYRRVMNNPTADGRSKDNYNERYTGTDDNGGVHINSGIMNLAFYLMSQGGTHPRSVTTNTVTGIGISKALNIVYNANRNLMTSSTNFQGARTKMAQAAATLYGDCSQEWRTVNQAFDAVLVPGTWTDCTSGDGGGSSGGDGQTGGSDTGTTPTPTPEEPTPPVNLAIGATASASSYYSNAWLPKFANDNNVDTSWASRYKRSAWDGEEWIRLNFSSAQSLSKLSIDWSGNQYPRRITVWVAGASGWVQVAEQQKSAAGASDIQFASRSTTDVLVRMSNFNAPYTVIREVSAYR